MALINTFPQSTGSSIPDGGTTDQMLAKKTNADQDVEWIDSGLALLPEMTGATSSTAGAIGMAPKPLTTDVNKFLKGDGTYGNPYGVNAGSTVVVKANTADIYGRTVTLSYGNTSVTGTMGVNGECRFEHLMIFGEVTATCTSAGGQTAVATINLTYVGMYSAYLTYDYSTIRVVSTNPAVYGGRVRVYKNGTVIASRYMAGSSASSKADIYVENTGSYDVLVESKGSGNFKSTATVSSLHQTVTVNVNEFYRCYAWKRSKTDSNPATAVTPYDSAWGCENMNFTPAHMDFTNDVFDYGSWSNHDDLFFWPKPCMLNYDGTVAYYLDPDDYTKRADGVTASDVGDFNFGGNAMMEFPTVYFNRWEDANTDYCVISDKKLTNDFKAYAHHDINGAVLPFIYISIYDGSFDGTRLRSISGKPTSNSNVVGAITGKIMSQTTREQEVNYAKANNSGGSGEKWYTWHKADRDLVNDLIILLIMNDDSQSAIGRGRDTGHVGETNTGMVATGSMNTKGMFWGENAGAAGVKVFGIENWWGNLLKAVAGYICDNGSQKAKMTYGTEDGSTTTGFNFNGSGYITISSATPSGTSSGYISKWHYTKNGMIPYQASGTASTYIPDSLWFNNSKVTYCTVGGNDNHSTRCGINTTVLSNGKDSYTWSNSAALSYKSLAS